jgi:ATP-dependent phosphoenolpyruvate carboxykinase
MTQTWNDTLNYIKSECKDLHLWYSLEQGWCYVTGRNGTRQCIGARMNHSQVKDIIQAAHSGRLYTPAAEAKFLFS